MQTRKTSNMPRPPLFRKLIGPSIILLGLGLGSGELILWPYLVSKYGLGIIWAAIIGISMQFFINMEIERYTLVRGESIFVGFARKFKYAPYWFILSTFVAWFWPGIIATSAKIFSSFLGIANYQYIAILALVLIGIILSFGRSLYKTVEGFQKVLIIVGLPVITVITLLIAKGADYTALSRGILGIGEGYYLLPKNIDLFVLLGALAYSGAGGNLNLAQSFYIKEKGYGMCRGTMGISGVLYRKSQKIDLRGQTFLINEENKKRFKKWWRNINLEHFLVFLLTGTVTILLLALLSYSTLFEKNISEQGVNFIITEAQEIKSLVLPLFGVLFMLFVSFMLFGTQLTVLDSTSRIIAENIAIIENKTNLAATYYTIVWLQIVTGIIVFLSGYKDPITLVVISAVINAAAMLVHVILTLVLNRGELAKILRAGKVRLFAIYISIAIFTTLFAYSIFEAIVKL